MSDKNKQQETPLPVKEIIIEEFVLDDPKQSIPLSQKPARMPVDRQAEKPATIPVARRSEKPPSMPVSKPRPPVTPSEPTQPDK